MGLEGQPFAIRHSVKRVSTGLTRASFECKIVGGTLSPGLDEEISELKYFPWKN